MRPLLPKLDKDITIKMILQNDSVRFIPGMEGGFKYPNKQ